MRTRKLYVSLCLLLLVGLATSSASLAQQQHDMSKMNQPVVEKVIDGSKNPEKIKDVDAWRLFLLAAKAAKSADELRFMFKAPLTDEQTRQISEVVANFAAKRQLAEDQYNSIAIANAATGKDNNPNIKEFLRSQKALTRQAQAQVEDILGSRHSANFHQVLELEKKKMKIAVDEENDQ